MTRGWWRRNRWGLIAVVPLTIGVFALNADGFYDRNWRYVAREPVPADASGAVALEQARIQLVDVSVPGDLTSLAGRGVTLPPSVRVWRARISVDAPDESLIGACEFTLEDSLGRVYDNSPDELSGFEARTFGCLPDDSDAPSPYAVTAYFLLPADARPVAVRITLYSELPRYARLPVR